MGLFSITEKKLMQKNIVMYSVFAEKAELMTAKINPGDKIVACGYSDGFVKIFHLKDQLKLHEYNTT